MRPVVTPIGGFTPSQLRDLAGLVARLAARPHAPELIAVCLRAIAGELTAEADAREAQQSPPCVL